MPREELIKLIIQVEIIRPTPPPSPPPLPIASPLPPPPASTPPSPLETLDDYINHAREVQSHLPERIQVSIEPEWPIKPIDGYDHPRRRKPYRPRSWNAAVQAMQQGVVYSFRGFTSESGIRQAAMRERKLIHTTIYNGVLYARLADKDWDRRISTRSRKRDNGVTI